MPRTSIPIAESLRLQRYKLSSASSMEDAVRALCNIHRWPEPRCGWRFRVNLRATLVVAWPDLRIGLIESPRISLLNAAAADGWRVFTFALDEVKSGAAEKFLSPLFADA